jgi:hypothetical protein
LTLLSLGCVTFHFRLLSTCCLLVISHTSSPSSTSSCSTTITATLRLHALAVLLIVDDAVLIWPVYSNLCIGGHLVLALLVDDLLQSSA